MSLQKRAWQKDQNESTVEEALPSQQLRLGSAVDVEFPASERHVSSLQKL